MKFVSPEVENDLEGLNNINQKAEDLKCVYVKLISKVTKLTDLMRPAHCVKLIALLVFGRDCSTFVLPLLSGR